MSEHTGIEWTDATWNPIRGCTAVSEGCRNCYAASMAARFSGPGQPYEGLAVRTPNGPRWTGKVVVVEDHLNDPLRWTRPRRIFVNSMSDLFHPALDDLEVARIFAVMAASHNRGKGHVFQVLTKRPERAAKLLNEKRFQDTVAVIFTELEKGEDWLLETKRVMPVPWPLPNVWMGTSTEDQDALDGRLPALISTPAAVRFLSAEPLLGPLDFRASLLRFAREANRDPFVRFADDAKIGGLGALLHWVIVGGESGPGARPMDLAWARSLRDQCAAAGVAYFFKQTGAVAATATKKGGSDADIPADLRVREMPRRDA